MKNAKSRITPVLITASLALLTACGGGGVNTTGGGLPATTPTPAATATPVPTTQSASVPVSTSAATVSLPTVGGYTPSVSLPSSNAAANTTIAATSTTVAPGGVVALQSLDRRTTASGSGETVYLYESLSSSSTVTFNGTPGFTVTLPSSVSTSGNDFYIAMLPPGATQWQMGAMGPGQVNGQTLTFAPTATPSLTLTQGQTTWLAFYSVPHSSNNAKVTLSTSALSFTSTTPQTFTATDSAFKGTFSVSGCTNVVNVTSANASGPNATFTVTPVNGGACTLTVSEGNSNVAATISISATLTQGTIQ